MLALFCVITPVTAAEPEKAPPHLAGLNYRLVGPYAGGRVSRSCGVSGDPLTYYTATASGGVWKSSDGGLNWKPIFDSQPTSSIGSLAVAPSDANVVYVGTGEANIRGNVTPGAGIFKSVDAGRTWKHVWKQVGQIGTMAVHPQNSEIAYAAVLGHAFGPNAERGVYRTKDGGKTWQKVLFKSTIAGCSDVAIDPNNPRVIYAGFWEAVRRPWELVSGGPGSDLYVSRDGGDTWTSLKKAEGLPKGLWGKVGVAVCPSNSERVYAIVENAEGGLFRSDDAGKTWSLASGDRTLRQRAWYYSTITVNPANADVLYLPNVPLLKSIDAGKTFNRVPGCHHGDHHDLWIDPKNPQRMIDSNDGGVDISLDGGKTWFAPPLPITQFYSVSADNQVPYRVMGCMQDLGAAAGPSNNLKRNGIGAHDWYEIGGGETGMAVPDPADPNIIYAGEYGGILTRWDGRTKQVRNVSVNQTNPSGIDPAKHAYRFAWFAPIAISIHDPKTVYHGGNHLFRTRDAGLTWEQASPDLTRNDKRKQQWSGGPITGDNTGAEVYCTLSSIAESPKQKGLLWVGSDDGLVHVSKDEGKTWTNLSANIPDLPDWGTVSCIEPSPHDAGTAYLVVDNHRMDDYKPHAWKTTDFGKSWSKIEGNLPGNVFLRTLREDPKKKDLLYAGSDRGISHSANGGLKWQSLQLNLPTVPVTNLAVKGDDLIVATQGRSLWILDDLTPLREWSETVAAKPLHLYPILSSTKWSLSGEAVRVPGPRGQNPTGGAVIAFYLSKKSTEGTLEILNEKGTVIAKAKAMKDPEKAKLSSDDEDDDDDAPPKRTVQMDKGLNRFIWDYTHDGAEVIPNAKVDSGNAGRTIPATPGNYTVRLTIGKETATAKFEVKPDPRIDVKAISKEKESLSLKVRDDVTRLAKVVKDLQAIQQQLKLRKELLKDNDAAKALLKDSATFGKQLTDLEEKLHNPKAKIVYDIFAYRGGAMLYSQLVFLLGNLTDGDGLTTKAQLEFAEACSRQLKGYESEFTGLVGKELKALNEAAKNLKVPEIYVPKGR